MRLDGASKEPVKRTVTLTVSKLASDAIARLGGASAAGASLNLSAAIRVYLEDEGGGRAGWAFPGFLSEAEPGERTRIEVEIDRSLWERFEAQAAGQEVTADRLADHAALYLAAEIESGRVIERLLESSGGSNAEGGRRSQQG